MIAAEPGSREEPIDQRASHRLFVEGDSVSSTDFFFFEELLKGTPVRVAPLGPSQEMRAAAAALHRVHPTYWFVVDRDHHDDETVERSWRRFPDPERANLLIWRKRMLESYFLDPAWLADTPYFRGSPDELERRILSAARRWIFHDIANLVIAAVRERLKRNWIQFFDRPGNGFTTAAESFDTLLRLEKWQHKCDDTTAVLNRDSLAALWSEELALCLSGEPEPVPGVGAWRDRMDAKPVFNSLIDPCFRFPERGGRPFTAAEKHEAVVRTLARTPRDRLPEDIRQLRAMIDAQLEA